MYQSLVKRFFSNIDQDQTSILVLALSIQLIGIIVVIFTGSFNGKGPIILSFAALLALLLAVAWFLIRAAKAYEADASTGDLEYVANLVMNGRLANFAKLIAKVLPDLFDKLFGSNPASPWFIWRSCVATTMFWIILILFRHPQQLYLGTYSSHHVFNSVFVISIYFTSWVSLIKTRFLLGTMLRTYKLAAILGLVFIDSVITLALIAIDAIIAYVFPLLVLIILSFTPLSPMYGVPGNIQVYIDGFWRLVPFRDYLFHHSQNIHLITVIGLTPLLTSVWITIMTISIIISILVFRAKYFERFIAPWFLEVEKSPVKAIARVAGSLMIAIAIAIIFWTL
jgi:hypothetical protein